MPVARPMRKRNSRRGETLVETLAAILVAALSVVLLVGGIAAAGRIGLRTAELDGDFYGQLTAAETPEGAASFTITAGLYGEGDLWAYAREEGEP